MPPMAGSGCSSHASAAASDPKAAASVRRNSLILASPNARLVASCPHSPSNQRLGRPADSNEGGHLFQSDRGHHSNLMAASLVSSRGPVLRSYVATATTSIFAAE